MWKFRSKKGFTLAEALLIVAIVGVVSAVVILSVVDYLRSTTKLEYDGYAKSIFVAAQNHLTMAEHEGYLGCNYFGLNGDDTEGVYRFVVQNGVDRDEPAGSGESKIKSLLPFALPHGSLDETVRAGSYLIRYQKSTAKVLDVFYWSDTGRYSYEYNVADYEALLNGSKDSDTLRDFDGAVIGHYGGAEADLERGKKLSKPQIRLFNAERLYVLLDNPNDTGVKTMLVVRGETSGNIAELDITYDDYRDEDSLGGYKIILDDVTVSGKHFAELFCSSTDNNLIPGEDITVYAVVYNDSEFTNVEYSSEQTTNSLFADVVISDDVNEDGLVISDVPKIGISNIRHLENLNRSVSGFDNGQYGSTNLHALQTTDLNWNEFTLAIGKDESSAALVAVYGLIGSDMKHPGFEPVNLDYAISYDGQNHLVSNLKVDVSGFGGMFGQTVSGVNISNLRLEDPFVTGTLSSGSLAGMMVGGYVRNVLVFLSEDAAADYLDPESESKVGVTSSNGFAGGLIGTAEHTSVEACATVINVEGNGSAGGAGGLVGQANASLIGGSYSSGFTYGGAYDQEMNIFTVKSLQGPAGGLVGDANSSQIDCCYSTCCVYGKHIGGLVGKSDGSIKHSYCTGLVQAPNSELEKHICGAFAGTVSGGKHTDGNSYFSIITYPTGVVGSGSVLGIEAFDQTTEAYKAFVSSSESGAPSKPYDDTLIAYYQGRYNLRTVKQLLAEVLSEEGESSVTIKEDDFVMTHYGDWPAPEIMVINVEKS